MNLKTFISRHKITFAYDEVCNNPNMDNFNGNHFWCELEYRGKLFGAYYSKGKGLDFTPTAVEFLDCLLSDANGDLSSFENWCDDYGYDKDSRKALKTFKLIKRQTNKLKKFLGADNFNYCSNKIERL